MDHNQQNDMGPPLITKDISIVLVGQAGQGLQTVANVASQILMRCHYHTVSTNEYMSRIRGGVNTTEIRIGNRPLRAFVERVDVLIPLDIKAISGVEGRIAAHTAILGEREGILEYAPTLADQILDLPLYAIASQVGKKIYANTVAIGVILGLFNIALNKAQAHFTAVFPKKDPAILNPNLTALEMGLEQGKALVKAGKIPRAIPPLEENIPRFIIDGNEAVTLGAIAGGCNFIAAYPMSPATMVFTTLSQKARRFGIAAEQAEDEISAINMAIGASYAGARAMTTTSGGGFALMTEGVSLAAMLETPVVIHIGQRPGPATGLPTRTEQADLNLVLYAGHGEFERLIYAPGNIEEAFELMQLAFEQAARFQIPVFVLTDHYFLDTSYTVDAQDFTVDVQPRETFVIETKEDYKRYTFTDSGISPRGIPGFGKGLVVVDSDEHDEEGHIYEDPENRIRMMDKRLKRRGALEEDALEPELIGPSAFKHLLISWGSTREVIKEALAKSQLPDLACLHFRQVYPLSAGVVEYLKQAEKTLVIENNATGQFRALLLQRFGIPMPRALNKYDGYPFSVEELLSALKEFVAS